MRERFALEPAHALAYNNSAMLSWTRAERGRAEDAAPAGAGAQADYPRRNPNLGTSC